jgi:hypothetical protein
MCVIARGLLRVFFYKALHKDTVVEMYACFHKFINTKKYPSKRGFLFGPFFLIPDYRAILETH